MKSRATALTRSMLIARESSSLDGLDWSPDAALRDESALSATSARKRNDCCLKNQKNVRPKREPCAHFALLIDDSGNFPSVDRRGLSLVKYRLEITFTEWRDYLVTILFARRDIFLYNQPLIVSPTKSAERRDRRVCLYHFGIHAFASHLVISVL